MELLSNFLGGAFLLFGALMVFASYVRQVTNFKNRDKENSSWSSPVPFIGPVFIIVGYAALPIEFSKWIFLMIVLDPDTVITILNIPQLIKGLRE
jgi:hypothetical protein